MFVVGVCMAAIYHVAPYSSPRTCSWNSLQSIRGPLRRSLRLVNLIIKLLTLVNIYNLLICTVFFFFSLGPKLGKFLAIFPSMYLSGATCTLIVINGGETMEILYSLVCGEDAAICHANRLSGVEWFLIFICVSIFLSSLFPSLNSLTRFSLIGSLSAVVYITMFWTVSVFTSRHNHNHNLPKPPPPSSLPSSSEASRIRDIINAIGIIGIAFRGHNVVLEIQVIIIINKLIYVYIYIYIELNQ